MILNVYTCLIHPLLYNQVLLPLHRHCTTPSSPCSGSTSPTLLLLLQFALASAQTPPHNSRSQPWGSVLMPSSFCSLSSLCGPPWHYFGCPHALLTALGLLHPMLVVTSAPCLQCRRLPLPSWDLMPGTRLLPYPPHKQKLLPHFTFSILCVPSPRPPSICRNALWDTETLLSYVDPLHCP